MGVEVEDTGVFGHVFFYGTKWPLCILVGALVLLFLCGLGFLGCFFAGHGLLVGRQVVGYSHRSFFYGLDLGLQRRRDSRKVPLGLVLRRK